MTNSVSVQAAMLFVVTETKVGKILDADAGPLLKCREGTSPLSGHDDRHLFGSL
jgi:hypothetical protein